MYQEAQIMFINVGLWFAFQEACNVHCIAVLQGFQISGTDCLKHVKRL